MKDDKQILLFIPSLSGEHDLGGATHQVELLNNMTKYFKILYFGNDWAIKFVNSPITSSNLPLSKNHYSKAIQQFIYFLKIIILGFIITKKTNVKLIYARHGLASIPSIILSKIRRIPVILEINGILSYEFGRYENNTVQTKICYLIDKTGINHATSLIIVTEGLNDEIAKFSKNKRENVHVINNGVNIHLFSQKEIKQSRKSLGLDNDYIYVLFIGTLAPWQGIEFLIESAATIIGRYPKTKFLIVGDGNLKQQLINLTKKCKVNDNFIFTGKVPYEQVPLYISATDICVTYKKPIKAGYSPLKIYEYMACGKPVIASRVNGFEFVENEKVGLLAEPENPSALAKAIITLIDDDEQRVNCGKLGRNLAMEKYSWETTAKKVGAVCTDVIKKHL